MTLFTTQMDAQLASVSPTIFGAVEILLPSYSIRLLDGAGTLTFGGNTFVGKDTTFGVLDTVETIDDGTGDDAPQVVISLLPASDAAAATLAAANMQGSAVSIWLGAVYPDTGLVVPDPLFVFYGALDVPTLKSGKNSRSLEYTVVSQFERFFFDDEGQRLSDTFHQSVWSGETGFSFVTGVEQPVYWGSDAPIVPISFTSNLSIAQAALAFRL